MNKLLFLLIAIVGLNCCKGKDPKIEREVIYLLLSQERGIPILVEDTNIIDPNKPALGDYEIFKIKVDTNGKIYSSRGWGEIKGKQLNYKGTFEDNSISLNTIEFDSVMLWSHELKKDGNYETTNSPDDTWLINMKIGPIRRIFYRQEILKSKREEDIQNKFIELLFDKIKKLDE